MRPRQSKGTPSLAAAIHYEEFGIAVPSMSATGANELAHELVRTAQRYGVPVVHRPQLAEALHDLAIDEAIPPELYDQVAEVFCALGHIPQAGRRTRP